jgi:aldehyde dehydrogenase (NAD+)
MLVPTAHVDEAIGIAKLAAETMSVGHPASDADLGPVASQAQWLRIQELIASGIAQGATLVTGGIGRPAGMETGCYVKPTIFAHVSRDMRIAREEIFGPVLCISSFESIKEAIDIANDTEYGLAAYIWGTDMARIHRVASKLRAGRVGINGVGGDLFAPFGGYKRSGNGREWGEYGFNEYLEVKAVLGYARATGT